MRFAMEPKPSIQPTPMHTLMAPRHARAAAPIQVSASPTQFACGNLLESMLRANPGTLAAVIGTADGRAFAHAAQPGQQVEAPRIAAVASSLLALSESFSGEALGSRAEYNSIATPRGTIVIVRVPTRARAHVLCLWADKSENFAMALRVALDCAAQTAALIDAD